MGLIDELLVYMIFIVMISTAVLFKIGEIYKGAVIFWVSLIAVSMIYEIEIRRDNNER